MKTEIKHSEIAAELWDCVFGGFLKGCCFLWALFLQAVLEAGSDRQAALRLLSQEHRSFTFTQPCKSDWQPLRQPALLTSVCQQHPSKHRSATSLCPNISECCISNLNCSNPTLLFIYGPMNYSPWYEPQSRNANLKMVLWRAQRCLSCLWVAASS